MMVEDHACKGNLAEQRWLDVDDSSPAMKPIDAKQTELTSYTVVLAYCPNIHRLYIGIYVAPRERVPSRQRLDIEGSRSSTCWWTWVYRILCVNHLAMCDALEEPGDIRFRRVISCACHMNVLFTGMPILELS
jgi:hypothetical protein